MTGRRRIPPSFNDATWNGTLPVDVAYGEMGVSFNVENGDVLRLRLPVDSARKLAESIRDYLDASQSPKSSGIESAPGSIPLLGKEV